jgi:hypothetical protein
MKRISNTLEDETLLNESPIDMDKIEKLIRETESLAVQKK